MGRYQGRVPLQQRGFTLLELLISITLLGMILVLLFGGLRLGVRSWDAVQQQVDNLNTVRAVESFLRREMSVARPYRWKGLQGQRIAFFGTRNQVSFVAQLPPHIGDGGLFVVSLELERSGKERRLLWRQTPLSFEMQDFSALAEPQAMVLAGTELSSVEDIWLSYFGQEAEKAAPSWTETWASDARLPMLIRIQVKFADGSEWPDFVVAPMLTSESLR